MNARQKIDPGSISGFPQMLPNQQIAFNRAIDLIRGTYELFGFVPLETPAVEKKDVLTAKGGDDKEIYSVGRLIPEIELNEYISSAKGNGEYDLKKIEDMIKASQTEMALRFDLTVPLARFVASHYGSLAFPFRRYQIQPVWRGERAQAGRYRQFYQCDIDVIGDGSLSLLNDAEMPAVIYGIFKQMNIGPFVIRINNRKVLQGIMECVGIVESDQIRKTMRLIDGLDKVGTEGTKRSLLEMGLKESRASKLLELLSRELSTGECLENLRKLDGNAHFEEGRGELETVVKNVLALGVPESHFKIDLGIARALNYYTGTVYETVLVDRPQLGSICSGGRYDDLASYYTDKKLPGVGISIGISRLMTALFEGGLTDSSRSTTADVLVTMQDPGRYLDYLKIAAMLRQEGIRTEVYCEGKGLGKQLSYAMKKRFLIAIIANGTELDQAVVQVKNLDDSVQKEHPISELAAIVKNILKK